MDSVQIREYIEPKDFVYINVSEKLETEVIVEGVETPAQKQGLKEMGCMMYQGFLFSRPVPVDEFEKLYLDSVKGACPERGVVS